MKKPEMIDAIVSNLPDEEAVQRRQELGQKSWDELTSIYRKHQAGLRVEETAGTVPEEAEMRIDQPVKREECLSEHESDGVKIAIKALTELRERTIGKNYRSAYASAIKTLNRLLQ